MSSAESAVAGRSDEVIATPWSWQATAEPPVAGLTHLEDGRGLPLASGDDVESSALLPRQLEF